MCVCTDSHTGYVKAEYAVGYFTEMGIGCRRDILEANVWYVKAADSGDDRAKQRLAAIRAAVSGGTPMEVAPPRNGKIKKNMTSDKDDKECVVM
jgi:TPR repeat protein